MGMKGKSLINAPPCRKFLATPLLLTLLRADMSADYTWPPRSVN